METQTSKNTDREIFKKKAKKNIDEIFGKIDKLEAKKDNVTEKAKAEYKELMADLKSKKADLQAKYKKLENATEDKWEDVKKTFSNAADSFEEGFSKIGSLFK
jgi:peptidoglycan hydrolase CwlO-like protein